MKHLKKIRYVCVLTAALALASCIYEEETSAGSAARTAHVCLTIVMSDAQSGTRAGTWGDDDYQKEAATRWENAIATGKLQVLVFASDNSYMGQVTDLVYTQSSQAHNVYAVTGALNFDPSQLTDGRLSCKFVVLANYDDAAQPTVLQPMSALESVAYRYRASAIAAQTAYIPMWGVKTFEGDDALSVLDEGTTQAGVVYMLRAMSKIRVSLSDDITDQFTLLGASVSGYNTRGYVLPAGFADVDETTSLFYSGYSAPLSFHPYASAVSQSLAFAAETEGQSFVIYLPECATSLSAASGYTDPCLSVTVAPKATPTAGSAYKINLRQYTDGVEADDCLDLVRNTVYDYVITAVGPTLTLRYQALDWTAGGGNIIFE